MTRPAPRPWLFAVVSAPYGAFNGLVAVALPYILRRRGMTVSHIAELGSLVQAPAIWYFLWSPIVDVGLRRRVWLIVLSVASAGLAAIALEGAPTASVRVITLLFVAASVLSQPISSALGGLAATVVPDALRGRTGGWSQAGIVVGAVIAGGVTVWLSAQGWPAITALVGGLVIALPAFAALLIDEPRPSAEPAVRHLRRVLRDVAAMLGRRQTWLGFVFFLSPIGAGALANLFSAVAPDYHTSTGGVIAGVALAGLLMPIGALVGGILCDRFDRWRMYPIAGLTTAVGASALYFAPLVPVSYIAGAAGYALTTGFCYAAFMSLAFQLVGSNSAASGTRFSLFMAAVNVPVVYMISLDGLGHARGGVRGMLAVEAVSNALFGLVFLAATLKFGGSLRRAAQLHSSATA